MSLRVLLVDDHAVLRSGLRLLLQTQTDFEVIGEAADGAQGLMEIRKRKPDLVILDLSMPGLGGLETLKQVMGEQPWLKVLILTMHDDAEFVRTALTAGAKGYVLKRAADTELLNALRIVGAGGTYIYPSVAAQLFTEAARESKVQAGKLSTREVEVLQLIALGYTQQEIAERLALSTKTVETHKARISEKLGAKTRAELVRYAISHGMVQID
ncbi:MAG TPA: response regulator transcription factor [Symbiobacteriaceae bacterium]|nr:response regulator transcription factor [Symbiobacteriaceae bacterium]